MFCMFHNSCCFKTGVKDSGILKHDIRDIFLIRLVSCVKPSQLILCHVLQKWLLEFNHDSLPNYMQ